MTDYLKEYRHCQKFKCKKKPRELFRPYEFENLDMKFLRSENFVRVFFKVLSNS